MFALNIFLLLRSVLILPDFVWPIIVTSYISINISPAAGCPRCSGLSQPNQLGYVRWPNAVSIKTRPAPEIEVMIMSMMTSHRKTFHVTGPLCGKPRLPVDCFKTGPVIRALMFGLMLTNGWIYSISQEICTRFLLCCALLWFYIDWFSHIHQAYFTGTVAI